MAHSLAPRAAADLDDIWCYTAKEAVSIDTADRLIDNITQRFSLLAQHPHIGRERDEELRPGVRSFPVGKYLIFYRIDRQDVVILRVLRGSRDIAALLGP